VYVSVDDTILPPEQKPGTRVKARNVSVEAISPTLEIVGFSLLQIVCRDMPGQN
jgi:hypothetical protein